MTERRGYLKLEGTPTSGRGYLLLEDGVGRIILEELMALNLSPRNFTFVSTPAPWGSAGPPVDNFTDLVTGYNRTKNIALGYDTAQIQLAATADIILSQMQYGLGRDVDISDPNLDQDFNGFVNDIAITIGAFSFVISMNEIVNRTQVKFTDFTLNVPLKTSLANDTDSQDIYGIIYKIINGGKVTQTMADKIRDVSLLESQNPTSNQSVGQSDGLSLSLTILGYGHKLKSYIYNNFTQGTYTAREKAIDIFEGEPNGIFSDDYTDLEANSLSVFTKEIEDRSGDVILKEILDLGGPMSDNARRMFMIGEDRMALIAPIPTEVDYEIRVLSGMQVYTDGRKLEPWEIKPGHLAEIIDVMTPVPEGDLRDPGLILVESVNFSLPFQAGITGGPDDTLPQILAKLGGY